MVSVIMPAYNSEKTIGTAIESVLRQSVDDIELIVINDCSCDRTAEIIRGYAESDTRVKVLTNEVNSGVSASRNYGISVAKGEWIAFLDSDDYWREDKLEKQLTVMNSYPDAVLSYTASSFIDAEGKPYDYIMEAEEKTDYRTLLKKNLLSCSSVMIKTDVMRDIKMPSDKMHEDYYVWLTVLRKTSYAYGVNAPLLIYRLSSNSKSSNRIRSAKMLYNSYRAVGYAPAIAATLTLRYSFHSIRKRHSIKAKGNTRHENNIY